MTDRLGSPSVAKRARDEADWQEIARIGARLQVARLDAGMSQTTLATELGVRQPDVSDWERGKHLPEARVIARWAEITGADLRDLLAARNRCLYGLAVPSGPAQRSFPEPPTLAIASSA